MPPEDNRRAPLRIELSDIASSEEDDAPLERARPAWQDDPHLRHLGALALFLVILGFVLPIYIWIRFSTRYGDDLGWQEGGGLYVFFPCLAFLVLCQAGGLLLAWKSWSMDSGKFAAIGAICLLALAGALVIMMALGAVLVP
jgi:hypothetical protein